MENLEETVKMRAKIAYGFSDLASCLAWASVGSFLTIYYTDVVGISAAAVGTMFMLTRIYDAINDPIMGVIIDKTHTRWGKCRPYFLWGCVPLAICMVATFSVPELSPSGKLIYAYITFTLLTMAYTMINIPVSAILPRLTKDPNQRTVFGVFRMYGSLVGNIGVGAATLGLVALLGAGNTQKGYTLTLTVYGILAIALFLIVFANIREIATSDDEKAKLSFKECLSATKGNIPWIISVLLGMLMNLMQGMRGTGMVYFFTYNLGLPGLIPAISMVGLVILVSLTLLPTVVKKWGKKKTVIIGNIVGIVGYGIAAVGANSVAMVFVGNIIGSIGGGLGFGLVFVLIADGVDYGKWLNGVSAEGFLSAAASFGQRLGTAVGSAAAAWILAAGRYVPGAADQAASARMAISFNYAIVPIIISVLNIVLICFWNVDKEMPQMLADLKVGRIRGQAAN
ncbi:MAG: MFS transporter [Treponema sp.]|jgi:GPH family glycoside/pentoside/hexuronide:cation symporter|nr:MFS transporter [Treponema sp.]